MSYDFYSLGCVRFQYSHCIVLIQLFWMGFGACFSNGCVALLCVRAITEQHYQ